MAKRRNKTDHVSDAFDLIYQGIGIDPEVVGRAPRIPGILKAIDYATNTIDIDHEEVKPKQLNMSKEEEENKFDELIELITNGDKAFRDHLYAKASEKKVADTLPGKALELNYVADFTGALVTVLQLMNVDFRKCLQTFHHSPVSAFTILDCKKVVNTLTKDRELGISKLKQAEKYLDISSGKKFDRYYKEFEHASKLVQQNFNQIRFI